MCSVDASVYFAHMDADGGNTKYAGNSAGAAYGTRDVKFINGEANMIS